jgi:hypothetical protein
MSSDLCYADQPPNEPDIERMNTGGAGGIFAGADALIDSFLALDADQSLRHKSVSRRLEEAGRGPAEFASLVSSLFDDLCSRRGDRSPSRENWRLERQTKLNPRNTSSEVMLERAVARLGELGVMNDWYNQVPVASGLVNAHADKRAAVDLVRFSGGQAELTELKWKSDTPAFAAFEILRYGLAFLYSYVNQHELGYGGKELMRVRRVSLRVLAPIGFYDRHQLDWLATSLSSGVDEVARENTRGTLSMDFDFSAFPQGFQIPFECGDDVTQMSVEDPSAVSVRAAVLNRTPVAEWLPDY